MTRLRNSDQRPCTQILTPINSCAGICITWEEFEPFNWNTQMLRNVYCKLPARLHQVPEVFKSNVPSGQLLSVFSWGRFQNAQLSCNRACAKLSFPTLSSPMDVALKLHLDSATAVADAESIVTKAIWDGGIDASVDHSKGWMKSKATGEIYSTQEPQQAFHSRIAFCLNTHNEAMKALRFP